MYEIDVTCSTRVPGRDTWCRVRIDPDEVANDQEAVELAMQLACGTEGLCTSVVMQEAA